MERQGRLGGIIYSIGILGLGVGTLLRRGAVSNLEPLPSWLPLRAVVATLVACVLVVAAGAIIGRWRTKKAATAVAAVLSAWLLVLHWPAVAMQPGNGGAWVVLWEVASMAVAAWMMALLALERDRAGRSPPAYTASALRIVFGLGFVAFGISHFVYHGYVESVIPSWIPARQFFTYATGVAHFAAGCSLLVRVLDDLATLLLAVMFGAWVVVLHIPRVLAKPTNADEWTSLLVAVCMCGASLIARNFLQAHSRPIGAGRVSPVGTHASTSALAEPWRSRS